MLILPVASYECEKHGLDHQPSFLTKIKFEDKFGKHNNMVQSIHIKGN